MADFYQTLEAGGVLILPTETVYGFFAKALNEEAVNKVYELKGRPRDKAMTLNVASLEEIYRFSKEQPVWLPKLCQAFLPGPLTIILKADNEQVPSWINSGLDTIGFRIPDHSVTLGLIRRAGPLIGPSANFSGQNSGQRFAQIAQEFGGEISGYADDEAIMGLDSTILDLSGRHAKILRQGQLTRSELEQAVPELIFDED